MTIFDIACEIIKAFEGVELSPYYCPADKLTIGYGEVVREHKKYGRYFGGHIIKQSLIVTRHINGRSNKNKALKQFWNKILTRQEAEMKLLEYLKNDIWTKVKNNLPQGLTDNQCGAIISFIYNVGVGAFLKSTLLKKLKQKDYNGASKEFDKWVFVDGKALNGLVRRRKAEKEFFLK